MASFRQLAPAFPPESEAQRIPHGQMSGAIPSQAGTKRKRHTHSKQEWDKLRSTIVQTYAEHTMNETMDIMKERCGFEASLRQYKKMLGEWGVEKHFPSDVLQFILQKSSERSNQGKQTVVLLNGARVDSKVIDNFRQRQQNPSQACKTFTPKVTPKNLEYYTPETPVATGDGLYATPHVFTPISKLSAFAVRNLQTFKDDPLALAILHFDDDAKKIRLTRVGREANPEAKGERAQRRELALGGKLDHELESTQRRARQKALTRTECEAPTHTHYIGDFAAVGNGRFERMALLEHLLWKSQSFAKDVHNLVHGSPAGNGAALTWIEDVGSEVAGLLEYHIYLESSCGSSFAIEPLITLLRHHKLIQQILGISRQDTSCWIGPWKPMVLQKASMLQAIATHLFGNPVKCYPNMQNLVLLVCFTTGDQRPLLLQISVAFPQNSCETECPSCDSLPIVVDYISQAGALKLRIPASAVRSDTHVEKIKDFTSRNSLKSTAFFGKWSQTGYMVQGLRSARQVRRCYCRGAIHKERSGPHYIDMQKELDLKNERWCSEPDPSPGEDFFQTFPGGKDCRSSLCLLVENDDALEDSSEEDLWDPVGVTGFRPSDDVFDPCPSEEDEAENQYVSKPIYCRLS